MARHLLVVSTNAADGRDDDFNRWYDEVHLPEVLQVPGFVAAQRYRLANAVRGASDHQYLAIYEIEADDVDAATTALSEAVRSMNMSDALDAKGAQALAFTAIGARATRSVPTA